MNVGCHCTGLAHSKDAIFSLGFANMRSLCLAPGKRLEPIFRCDIVSFFIKLRFGSDVFSTASLSSAVGCGLGRPPRAIWPLYEGGFCHDLFIAKHVFGLGASLCYCDPEVRWHADSFV